MGLVYLHACDLTGEAMVDVHADDYGDIWIVTSGDGSVMLESGSARLLAAELIRLAENQERTQCNI